ncbi:Protein of unknown function [Gryllus bimaculatus]|nr:Protein of unknown function [Gryllus bimaculatus]
MGKLSHWNYNSTASTVKPQGLIAQEEHIALEGSAVVVACLLPTDRIVTQGNLAGMSGSGPPTGICRGVMSKAVISSSPPPSSS